MGRALATAFAAAGHAVTVWNRTAEKAFTLAGEQPAVAVAATPGEAVAASELTIVCLRDAELAGEVLQAAGAACRDRAVVSLSSGTPAQARATAALAAGLGARPLSGAILTPTPTIGTPSAVVLYDGPEGTFAAHWEALEALGGVPRHLGPDHGRAAAHEVALLALFASTVHGLAHAFALATTEDVAPSALAPYTQAMAAMLPEMATRFARQLEERAFPGERSAIGSFATAVGHVVDAVEAGGLDAAALRAMGATAQRAVAAGHAGDGLARLALHL